jgi:hypothetical protein
MRKPRLIYYNDGHHYHGKRIDPPLSLRKMHWPVDEVVGTGVEMLVFGMGYGDVFFHQSKIGRTIGEAKDVWESFIDWRIMRMVRDAKELYQTDQFHEVIRRGKQMKMPVVASLKMNDGHVPEAQRSGWLRWNRGREVCLREPPNEWFYDYTNPEVIEYKQALIREILEDYGADGIELDFMFSAIYFRKDEVDKGVESMSKFVADVRKMADEIGSEQGREISVAARVYHQREANLKTGLDVETWLKEGSVDLVVGQVSPASLFETGDVDGRWMADAANASGKAAYIRPPLLVYDERTIFVHIEMYRALRQSLDYQGFAGLYLGYLPWPFTQTEHQILREVAYPEIVARHDKRYILQPRETAPAASADGRNMAQVQDRVLPAKLEEGKTASINILVGDDLEGARKDREMRKPILTVRFAEFCVEDDIEIRFNGKVLSLDDAEMTDERATRILGSLRTPSVDAPDTIAGFWFRFRLDIDLLRQGDNTLEVEARRFEKTAGFDRKVSGVEVQTRFRDFVRPEGLSVERMPPTAA